MGKGLDLIGRGFRKLRLFGQVGRINQLVSRHANPDHDQRPIIFFNASARLEGLNLNAAFQLITSWGIQLAGRRVVHITCRSGMSQCVLGAGLGDPCDSPPCPGCIQHTKLFSGAGDNLWFDFQEDPELNELLRQTSIAVMQNLEYQGRPLGELVLPSIRWILRRHHLEDDPTTRYLFTQYILSAHSMAEKLTPMIEESNPEAVVVFNGLQYPEAVVRWISIQHGIKVITHEVNLLPFSAFFTDGQATIYPLSIPEDFQLSSAQEQRLDGYLSRRFRGDFKMAGIKFWSDMSQLPEEFKDIAAGYEGLIPVFTNVIFDTSQAHANTLFSDMFEWLDLIYVTAQQHPDHLFVIRAHPDETRAGKSSQETVLAWAEDRKLSNLDNVYLIEPDETLSSYELIRRSKFTLVYNSSIGLEASLLGSAVLNAGRARYTQNRTVHYPESRSAYIQKLEDFLSLEDVKAPPEHGKNARKYLYYQLFRASLPFTEFLIDHPTPGYVQLRQFGLKNFLPGSSPVLDCVVNGILKGDEFILEHEVI